MIEEPKAPLHLTTLVQQTNSELLDTPEQID